MEGKTVKYRISRDEWKLFFARLAPKARYLWYLFALTAVFYALYTLLSMALAGTTAAGAVYLLFVVYILLFIYIARGALPRGRLERYERRLQDQYGTANLHYEITFGADRFQSGCRERSKQKMEIPYGSVEKLTTDGRLVVLHLGRRGAGVSIVCPADAFQGGAQGMIDLFRSKNPSCKVVQR